MFGIKIDAAKQKLYTLAMFHFRCLSIFCFLFSNFIFAYESDERIVTIRVRSYDQNLSDVIIKAIPANKKRVLSLGQTDQNGLIRANLKNSHNFKLLAYIPRQQLQNVSSDIAIAEKEVSILDPFNTELLFEMPPFWMADIRLYRGTKKVRINQLTVNKTEVLADKNQPFLLPVGVDLEISAKGEDCFASKIQRIYPRVDDKKRIVMLKCS